MTSDQAGDDLRVVVLGSGSIGSRHREVLGGLPGVDVVVVPARPERAAELREQGIVAVDTLPEALADGPAGVVVATDSGRHAADAVLALGHGAHVLVEKPLATSAAAARSIVEAAERSGRHAHVASCLRFDPGIRWIAERRDAIGALRFVDAECTSWLPDWRAGRDHRDGYAAREGEGGVLFDLIHEIDLCGWFAGPLHVQGAVLANGGVLGLPAGVEETAALLATGSGATPVTIRLSFSLRSERRVLRLVGDDGTLEWNFVDGAAVLRSPSGAVGDRFDWDDRGEMYRAQAAAWVAHLRGEPAVGLVDAREGAEAVAVCDAARRAGGEPVGPR